MAYEGNNSKSTRKLVFPLQGSELCKIDLGEFLRGTLQYFLSETVSVEVNSFKERETNSEFSSRGAGLSVMSPALHISISSLEEEKSLTAGFLS